MIFVMCIGLYTSRDVLQNLGVQDFGLYNLVGGVVSMFAFLNSVINASTIRYLTFNIGKGNKDKISDIFSIAQINHLGIACCIFILTEIVGLWMLYNYLVIPPERLQAAVYVLHFSIFTCCLSILNAPLSSTIFAYEEMNAYALITTITAFLKLFVVLILGKVGYDKLVFYSCMLFVVGVIEWSINRFYCSYKLKEIKFHFVKDWKLYKNMLSFAGWSLVNWGIFTFYSQGLTILLNLFIGPVANAARGIAMQVYNNIYSFCSNFQGAINPQITKKFATENYEDMASLISMSSKYCFILLLTIIVAIYSSLDYILKLWLGVVPAYTNDFVVAILVISLLSILNNPLETAINAYGEIKKIRIRNGLILLFIVPTAYLYLSIFGTRVAVTVFYIQLLYEFVAYLSNIFYIFPIIGIKKKKYIKEMIVPLFLYWSLTIVCVYIIKSNILICDFFNMLIIVTLSIIISLVIAWQFALNRNEKQKIIQIVALKLKYTCQKFN